MDSLRARDYVLRRVDLMPLYNVESVDDSICCRLQGLVFSGLMAVEDGGDCEGFERGEGFYRQ